MGILAAGASSRMRGRDKLLETVGGSPLLALQVRRAVSSGVPVLVALPPGAEVRRKIVAAGGAQALVVPDATSGLSASIAALAGAARDADWDGLLLALADMPEIEASDIARILAAARANPQSVLRAADEDGTPGHPVVFPRRCYPELARLTGDTGARALLAAEPDLRLVPLPGQRARRDLDTPEEWAAWRRGRAGAARDG